MNAKTNTTSWDLPNPLPEFGAKHSAEEFGRWAALRQQVAEIARENGFTKSGVAQRAALADSTFSQWLFGKYLGTLGSINKQIEDWLRAFTDAGATRKSIPVSPAFMRLKASQEILQTLEWAQYCPDFVMITGSAGIGKTEACKFYRATHPHVFFATVSENTKTVHGMLVELAEELEVREHNPARLARAIGNRVKRIGDGSLLIVDEGQHLNDEALNQLRFFCDIHRCGVAVVGNKEVYGRFQSKKATGVNRSYDQVKSRVGKSAEITHPYTDDLMQYIAAWGSFSDEVVQSLVGIGQKGGALRQIEKTLKLALMLAGPGEELTTRHIDAAWSNRNVEKLS